jgi:hypothetical protein
MAHQLVDQDSTHSRGKNNGDLTFRSFSGPQTGFGSRDELLSRRLQEFRRILSARVERQLDYRGGVQPAAAQTTFGPQSSPPTPIPSQRKARSGNDDALFERHTPNCKASRRTRTHVEASDLIGDCRDALSYLAR